MAGKRKKLMEMGDVGNMSDEELTHHAVKHYLKSQFVVDKEKLPPEDWGAINEMRKRMKKMRNDAGLKKMGPMAMADED